MKERKVTKEEGREGRERKKFQGSSFHCLFYYIITCVCERERKRRERERERWGLAPWSRLVLNSGSQSILLSQPTK
jgi:hypothetical protein